jgi:putative DNA primase/helicase
MTLHGREIFKESAPPPQIPSNLEGLERLVAEAERIDAVEDPNDVVGWPEPEELGEELPAVPAFDAGLLPASLRPMVEDVADRMQVPLDFPAIVCMSVLAGLCERRALIQPKEKDDSWLVVPNLWGRSLRDRA